MGVELVGTSGGFGFTACGVGYEAHGLDVRAIIPKLQD